MKAFIYPMAVVLLLLLVKVFIFAEVVCRCSLDLLWKVSVLCVDVCKYHVRVNLIIPFI